jgi:DNA-binding NarL/FixJ family response regulator
MSAAEMLKEAPDGCLGGDTMSQAPRPALGRFREVPAVGLAGGLAPVRIALVAPDLLSRAGVEGLLEGYPALRLVPDSRSGDADLLVLVAAGPGPEIAEALRAASGPRRLPILAVLDGPGASSAADLAELGVVGCLWRSEITPERLAEEVLAVVSAPPPARSARSARLVGDLDAYRQRQGRGQAPNRREADVLRLLAEGLGIPEIAQRLAYSERTVQKTLYAVTSRLELRNRTHAVAYAWREGVL